MFETPSRIRADLRCCRQTLTDDCPEADKGVQVCFLTAEYDAAGQLAKLTDAAGKPASTGGEDHKGVRFTSRRRSRHAERQELDL